MNKKLILFAIQSAFVVLTFTAPAHALKYKFVTPNAPAPSAELKEYILKYKQGNYTGAMVDLENMLKKDRNNNLARYYLALCYTQLGYQESAKKAFGDVVARNTNEVLTYYSQRSLTCLDNPSTEICTVPPGQEYKLEEAKKLAEEAANNPQEARTPEQMELDSFIQSGRKIHPAAMDAIMNERNKRWLEEEEYRRNENKNDDIRTDIESYNSQPTNEEIVAALNTLSKIGVNPFRQNMYSMNYMSNNDLSMYPQMTNQDIARLMMYNGYQRPELQYGMFDNFVNYGI